MTNLEVIRRLTPSGFGALLGDQRAQELEICEPYYVDCREVGCEGCIKQWLDSDAEKPRGLWKNAAMKARFAVEKATTENEEPTPEVIKSLVDENDEELPV